MFEKNPAVKTSFEKFRELDDGPFEASPTVDGRQHTEGRRSQGRVALAQSTVLQTHGMVVMNAMDEIMSCLDEASEVVELILEQGRSHARFGDNLTEDVFWVRVL
jgi:hypothetical protein